MKGTLEFNLPDEQSDFNLASNATKWYLVAWDMDQHMRSILKYGDDETKSDDYYKAVEEIRADLYERMSDRGLSFDDNW